MQKKKNESKWFKRLPITGVHKNALLVKFSTKSIASAPSIGTSGSHPASNIEHTNVSLDGASDIIRKYWVRSASIGQLSIRK